VSAAATAAGKAGAAIDKFATPGVATIAALARPPFNVPAEQQIKTLVYIANDKPIIILMRGDDQLNEAKLAGKIGSTVFRAATAGEIFAALGAHPGSLGAVKGTARGAFAGAVLADERLRGAAGMTTGANEDGFHLRNVSMERDVAVSQWADLRTVKAGEPCKNCGAAVQIRRAIEVGHVFKLGVKYSEKFNALYLDEAGNRKLAVMGCYGIGVTRTLQAVIEHCNDKDGIIWPISVAPYEVCITPLEVDAGSEVMKTAEALHAGLLERGVDVILDDRDERPGVKFKDTDLVGFPIRAAIGGKSLARGEVEIKPRGGAMQTAKTGAALETIVQLVKSRAQG
ncbi:MAG: proline--tRNA ligase, partial [Verrucomicrobia bacterium]|nr:proline--tRNA ligase [Verrucomicrobiota bacterium]